jgi:hypothetical protein
VDKRTFRRWASLTLDAWTVGVSETTVQLHKEESSSSSCTSLRIGDTDEAGAMVIIVVAAMVTIDSCQFRSSESELLQLDPEDSRA